MVDTSQLAEFIVATSELSLHEITTHIEYIAYRPF